MLNKQEPVKRIEGSEKNSIEANKKKRLLLADRAADRNLSMAEKKYKRLNMGGGEQ